MKKINVLSLFDGMSCGYQALKESGKKVNNYFASEVDRDAIKIAMKNHPDIVQLGDVVEHEKWELPKIDLLIAGSPCQGFSFAGKQLAFDDPRSKLFFEFVEILKNLRAVNPDIKFMLENVRMKKEYQDVITDILGVEPIMINSALVSAQNRVRLYWTNIEGVGQPEDKGILLNDILEDGYHSNREKSYCIDANYNKGSNFKRYFFRSSRQIVFEPGYFPTIKNIETSNKIMHDDGNKWRVLTELELERVQTLPEDYTKGVIELTDVK